MTLQGHNGDDTLIAGAGADTIDGGFGGPPPLRELGDDPVSGKPVVVKAGRYGPYVTDGETNVSLASATATVETITIERAGELLQARRDAGPSTLRRGRQEGDGKKARPRRRRRRSRPPRRPRPRRRRGEEDRAARRSTGEGVTEAPGGERRPGRRRPKGGR